MGSWGGMKKQDAIVFNADVFEELKTLVWQGEGQHLEFKRKASTGEKIMSRAKPCCGMW